MGEDLHANTHGQARNRHATALLSAFSRRTRRSILKAADLHLLSAELDRPASTLLTISGCVQHRAHQHLHPSAISRRVQDGSLTRLYHEMLRDLLIHDLPENYFVIDSKTLPIAWHSTDATATIGASAGHFSRGYRLHVLVDRYEQTWAARVTPMNVREPAVALELIADAARHGLRGLLLADRGYDAKAVFDAAHASGLVMLARRRVTKCSDPKPADSPARYRSFLILEKFPRSHGDIAAQFTKLRDTAERAFAHLCGRGGGLTSLPPWVRTMPRVRAWVLAKLVLQATRQRDRLIRRMCATNQSTESEAHA